MARRGQWLKKKLTDFYATSLLYPIHTGPDALRTVSVPTSMRSFPVPNPLDGMSIASLATGVELLPTIIYLTYAIPPDGLLVTSVATGVGLQVVIVYLTYAVPPDGLLTTSVATGLGLQVVIEYVLYAIPADGLSCNSVATGIRLGP